MTPERIEEIIDDLRGTCKSIDNVLEDGEDPMDPELTDAIDNAIFCCVVCEWWCDLDEANASPQGDVCDDDKEDEEEE